MPRKKTLKLAALNLTLHPHAPESYVKLWNALFDLHKPVPVWGDQSLMLGRIEAEDKSDPTKGYVGLIFRFTTIDTTKPWFDLNKGAEADPAIVEREVKIPNNLCPNLVTFIYKFFPKGHRLIIESVNATNDSLSPSQVEKLLNHLIADKKIADRFENISVNLEQEKEAIAGILNNHRLKELTIIVKRPNPGDDDSDDDEKKVFGELIGEKAKQKTISLVATKNESVTPNENTKRYARVAKSNGSVKAVEERTDGTKAALSSKDHPQFELQRYNPSQQDRVNAFTAAASDFLKKLVGNKVWPTTQTTRRPPPPPVV